MMKFGVCADLSKAEMLAAAGYDFIEGGVVRDLMDYPDEKAFDAF